MSNVTLKKVSALQEKAASLIAKLGDINSEIASLLKDAPAAAVSAPAGRKPAGRKPGKSAGGRAPRGTVKDAVISELKAAGKGGISVVELAEKIGTKTQNLYTWFNQTGKRMSEIKKVGRGTYRYVGR